MEQKCSEYCMNVDTDINLESVILSDVNRKKLEEFIIETNNKAAFISHGLKPINRLLMYGASGTGKTYLTKALSNYLGYSLYYIDISKAFSAGIVAQALTDIFEIANKIGKAIIFLDECDAICWARDDAMNNDTAEIRRANNTLFQLLDQMNPDCVFVSATNLYNNLDLAFVNRFNVLMEFDRPTKEDIDKSIAKFKHETFSLDKDMKEDIKEAVLNCVYLDNSLSYRRIRDWVERVEKDAIINGTEVIRESEVYKFLMQALRIEVCYDKQGKLYLHQYAKGRYS